MSSLFRQLDADPLTDEVELSIGGRKKLFDFIDVVSFCGEHYVLLAEKGSDEAEVYLIKNAFSPNEDYLVVENEKIREKVFEIYEIKNEDF